MDKILDFLADNYVIFIVISGILLLALIGFIVTGRKKKKGDVKTADAVAQPAPSENAIPMAGDMPTTPVEPTPNMNTSVTPEVPVEPAAQQMNMDTNTAVEPQAAPMEPVAPTNSDEPTLIIEDKSIETPTVTEEVVATPESAPVENAVPTETESAPVMPSEETPQQPTEATLEPSNEPETTSIFENQ